MRLESYIQAFGFCNNTVGMHIPHLHKSQRPQRTTNNGCRLQMRFAIQRLDRQHPRSEDGFMFQARTENTSGNFDCFTVSFHDCRRFRFMGTFLYPTTFINQRNLKRSISLP